MCSLQILLLYLSTWILTELSIKSLSLFLVYLVKIFIIIVSIGPSWQWQNHLQFHTALRVCVYSFRFHASFSLKHNKAGNS